MKTAIKFCRGSISGAQFDSLKKILDFGVFRPILQRLNSYNPLIIKLKSLNFTSKGSHEYEILIYFQ